MASEIHMVNRTGWPPVNEGKFVAALSRPWVLWFSMMNVAIALVSGVLQMTQQWHGRALIIVAITASALAFIIFGTRLIMRFLAFARRLTSMLEAITPQLQGPSADLVAASARLRETQLLLGRLVDRLPHHFVESMEVDFIVGSSDDDDTVVRTFTTQAAEPGHTVPLRTWGETVIPSPRPPPTYDSIGISVNTSTGTCRDLPILDDGTHISGIVEFEPPISAEPVEWRLSYSFPGLWRPLRTRGRDSWLHRFNPNARISSLRVRFTFPIGVEGTFEPKPAWGEVTTEVINGHQTLAWNLAERDLENFHQKNARPGQRWVLVLYLRAEGFAET